MGLQLNSLPVLVLRHLQASTRSLTFRVYSDLSLLRLGTTDASQVLLVVAEVASSMFRPTRWTRHVWT